MRIALIVLSFSLMLFFACSNKSRNNDNSLLRIEEINDLNRLKKIIDNSNKKMIYVLFYIGVYPDTSKDSADIMLHIESLNTDATLLLVPWDNIGLAVPNEFNLKGSPTLIIFANGKEDNRYEGHEEIQKWLKESKT